MKKGREFALTFGIAQKGRLYRLFRIDRTRPAPPMSSRRRAQELAREVESLLQVGGIGHPRNEIALVWSSRDNDTIRAAHRITDAEVSA